MSEPTDTVTQHLDRLERHQNRPVAEPTVLSNLCRQLGVPPDEFGLVIGSLADTRQEGTT